MKSLTIVLVSGGMDSAVCASIAQAESTELAFLHMKYGQRTSAKEVECFNLLCDFYKIPKLRQKIIDMSFLGQIGGSSLTDKKILLNKETQTSAEIPNSYVPFRNSIILSLAVSWAEVMEANKIIIGANHEDSPGYPDCRPIYYDAFNQLISVGTKNSNIKVLTPVINMTKAKIVETGIKLNTPFHLTWSCYDNDDISCGKCESCQLRLKGFKNNNLIDPLLYEG